MAEQDTPPGSICTEDGDYAKVGDNFYVKVNKAQDSAVTDVEFESKRRKQEAEQRVKQAWQDPDKEMLRALIAQLALDYDGALGDHLGPEEGTKNGRKNWELLQKILEEGGNTQLSPAELKQVQTIGQRARGAHWCGIFACYILQRAGKKNAHWIWGKGIHGLGEPVGLPPPAAGEARKKLSSQITKGDICIIRNPKRYNPKTKQWEVVQVNHHCIVVEVGNEQNGHPGEVLCVNGNSDSGQANDQAISVAWRRIDGDPGQSNDIAAFYKVAH